MQWFRFYSETVNDPKIRRIARSAQVPQATVVGVWATLLSVASDSPERGKLLMGTSPVIIDDLNDIAGMDVSLVLDKMIAVGMLDIDVDSGAYIIPNWDKRQFASDNVTARVHKSRAKQREGEGVKRFSNVSGTGGRNGPETETETETEAEAEQPAAATADPYVALEFKANAAADAVVKAMVDEKYKRFLGKWDHYMGKRTISSSTSDFIHDWSKLVSDEEWDYALGQADKYGKKTQAYIEKVLERVQYDGIPEEGTTSAKGKDTNKVSGTVKGFSLSQLGM
jgi:hypothetical protein